MSQGKTGISSDRIAQVLSGFIEQRWIAGRTDPVAPYEFRIRHRVLAISCAALHGPWAQRPVQGNGDLLRNLVLNVGQAVHIEITFPGEASALHVDVKHFHREAPYALGHLNGAVDDKTDTKAGSGLRRCCLDRHIHHRGNWENVHARQIAQARDQCVRKSQAYAMVIGSLPEKNQGQDGQRRALVPPADLVWADRKIGWRITRINHTHRSDESVPFAYHGL